MPEKRRRYIFGDFVSFVHKVNKFHRLLLLKKGLKLTTYKFEEEIKNKYKSLKKNNINNFNFAKHIQSIFAEINFNFNYYERNYQGKLNIYKLCKLTEKYLFLIIIKKIYLYINIKNTKAIIIQSYIRRLITIKKFNALKRDINTKTIIIQKYIRGFLIRNKYKENLEYIINTIEFNKGEKEYEKRVKIMLKKRKAIRVIEEWWEKILEERRNQKLEEKIKKMPKDCQDLFRQFRRLRKQTRSIKIEFKEFTKGKYVFSP